MRSGIWGELLSTAASNSGCIGVIVDGGIRDVGKIRRRLGFAVFALGNFHLRQCQPPSARDRHRRPGRNRRRHVAQLGRHLVFADEDGVVVVPQQIEEIAIRCALPW